VVASVLLRRRNPGAGMDRVEAVRPPGACVLRIKYIAQLLR